MEKNTEIKTLTLHEDEKNGSVKIADDVIAAIARLAVGEVEGASPLTNSDLMKKFGVKDVSKGVKVEVQENDVKISIAVVIDYGFNIPSTCSKVQEKIRAAVENMTGLNVTDVNIRIMAVNVK
ncbi:MAG: Asp23/Gls24 family envelope stress response protein [Acetatifactor sp.]|nr:Asp23/Gls24 family envelope stress response protein [Acetatifactor sp.]